MDNSFLDVLENMGAEVDDTIERLLGDEELYIQQLKKLPDNQNIIRLRKAVDAGDADAASKEVHSLKGIALNLGILPLVDVCMDMLLDFRADKPAEAMAQIDEVEACFNEWKEAIQNN